MGIDSTWHGCLALTGVTALLSQCAPTRLPAAWCGVYRGEAGQAMFIQPDGLVGHYQPTGEGRSRNLIVGYATPDPEPAEVPTLFIRHPDSSGFLGTRISRTRSEGVIELEWQGRAADPSMSTRYRLSGEPLQDLMSTK